MSVVALCSGYMAGSCRVPSAQCRMTQLKVVHDRVRQIPVLLDVALIQLTASPGLIAPDCKCCAEAQTSAQLYLGQQHISTAMQPFTHAPWS